MSVIMKKQLFTIFFILFSLLFGALEEYEVPPDNLSAIKFPATFENSYKLEYKKRYKKGEVLTLNVSVVDPDVTIDKMTFVWGGKNYSLLQFTDDLYITHIPLGGTYGDFKGKLFIKGSPFNTQQVFVPFSVEQSIVSVNVVGVSHNLVEDNLRVIPGDFLNEMKVKVDIIHLKETGLFQSVSVNISETNKGINVKYFVSMNPVMKSIELNGLLELSQKEILKRMKLKPGMVFSSKLLVDDIRQIEKEYKEKGFIFAKIVGLERPSLLNDYKLKLYINEGRIRSINFVGNSTTKETVIRREMDIKAGDAFNSNILKNDLRKIFNLNYFSNIVPDVRPINDDRDVDIEIKLEEKKTSSINFGGGYGEISGWFGFIDLLLDNIGGSAQSLLLKSSWGDRLTTYQIKYHNPWMWDKRVSLTSKFWSTKSVSYVTSLEEQRNGWSVSIGKPKSLYVRENYSFSYEDVFVPADSALNYKLRTFGYQISYDNRDQWMNPTKGHHDLLAIYKNLPVLSGTIDNWKISLEHNEYHLLKKKQVFAIKALYNVIIGDKILTDEYYVGSETTVRGYSSIFAKGSERWIFNFEYRYLFNDMFQGFAFYDIGEALYTIDYDFDNHVGWGSSTGFGLRILLPIGPVGLVYAWPQYHALSEGSLNFSIGHQF